jgi:hypothetical protein
VNVYFFVNSSGWIATLLVGIEILLPYLLRQTRLSLWLRIQQERSKSYLKRMAPHDWLGYLLIPISLLHAWVPMKTGVARGTGRAGSWAAAAALALLILQTLLGLLLKDSKFGYRRQVRRWHYFVMLTIVFLIGVHLWLNS